MALSDEVTSRLSSRRLIELTNPDTPGATTVDSTRLGLACTDTQADFEIHAGTAYDGTKATHVATAIDGVIYHLSKSGDARVQAEVDKRWLARLDALSLVTGRNRIAPSTTSEVVPVSEVIEGATARADLGRHRNLGALLRPPRARSEGDE